MLSNVHSIDEASPNFSKPPPTLMWWLMGLLVVAGACLVTLPAAIAPYFIHLPTETLVAVLLWRMSGLRLTEPATWFALSLGSDAIGLVFQAIHDGMGCKACLALPVTFFWELVFCCCPPWVYLAIENSRG